MEAADSHITKIDTINKTLTHSGDKTHHHDQSMYLVNLRVIRTIVSNPQKPIPDDDVFDSFPMLVIFLLYLLSKTNALFIERIVC